MNRGFKKWCAVAVLLGAVSFNSAFADVNGDLNSFFNNMGYASNVTGAHAYQDQVAGYYSGGSMFVRAPSRNLQLAQISLPTMKAGCGGIDIFTGGFSFVSSDQLIGFAKNIMTNAAPYAFNLAMETYAPQIHSIYTEAQYWAQQFNQNNLSSCQAAQSLVGGMWPQHTAAQRQICQDLGLQNHKFSDWAAARQGCGFAGQGDSTLDDLKNTPEGKKEISRNVNIVWQSIMQNGFLQNDTTLAQFFMTLSGTVVFDQDGNPNTYPSLIGDGSVLNALMNGGQATVYVCSDTKDCLNISTDGITIDPNSALTYRINQMLLDIASRYAQDQPMSPEEIGFVNSISIPVVKFIQVSLESGNQIDTNQYAQIVAQDLLSQYLQGIINLVQESLSNSQFDDAKKEIDKNLAVATRQVQQMDTNVYQYVVAQTALIQQSMQYQQMVMGSMSSQFQSSMKY